MASLLLPLDTRFATTFSMSTTCYNFYAGPSALPAAVREQTIAAIRDFAGTGVGILEISHRSSAFEAMLEETKNLLRRVLSIPESHEVIFTTGGASQQFSMVPLNLLANTGDKTGEYIVTGLWAKKAFAEAKRLAPVALAASSESSNFDSIPETIQVSDKAHYLHYTSNNTIYGTQFKHVPDKGTAKILVCDASSDICSRQIDFSKTDLLYAGAQKNIGTAGVTVVIAKRNLLEQEIDSAPLMMQYSTHLKAGSLYNTPPSFAIYTLHAMLQWVESQGGVEEMEKRAKLRAATLYKLLDEHDCFIPHAQKESRSLINVAVRLAEQERTAEFIQSAEEAGLLGLAGHRSLGGLRISLYNGIDPKALSALCEFLQNWAKK